MTRRYVAAHCFFPCSIVFHVQAILDTNRNCFHLSQDASSNKFVEFLGLGGYSSRRVFVSEGTRRGGYSSRRAFVSEDTRRGGYSSRRIFVAEGICRGGYSLRAVFVSEGIRLGRWFGRTAGEYSTLLAYQDNDT